jgi:mRNA interferase RelE/StbE
MRYEVLFQPSAGRQIRKLPADVQRRVVLAAEALGVDPRPAGCQRLKGPESIWRIRVGDYRILYEIRDKALRVLVVRVGHRREVYRRGI